LVNLVKAVQRRVGIYIGPERVHLLFCKRSLQGRLSVVSKMETAFDDLANLIPLEWRGARAYVAVTGQLTTPVRLTYPKGVLSQLPKVLPYDLQTHLPEGEEGTFAYSVVVEEDEAEVHLAFLEQEKVKSILNTITAAGLRVGGVVPSFWALTKAIEATGSFQGEGGYTLRENGCVEGVLLRENGDFGGFVPSSHQLAEMVLEEVGEHPLPEAEVHDGPLLSPGHLMAYGALLAGEDPATPSFKDLPFKVERTLPLHLVFYLAPPLVLIFLTLLLTLPIDHLQGQLTAKEKEFKQIKARLSRLEAKSKEKERLQAMIRALSSFRAETGPKKIDILEELTKRLPEDAWVSNLSIRGKKMTIRGQAASAISLINALDESPMFSNVHFISSVTKNRRTGKEYFNIQVSIGSPKKGAGNG